MKTYTREEYRAKRLDHVPLKNCRFRIGDKVRIVKPEGVRATEGSDDPGHQGYFYADDAGHMQTWTDAMDELVGTQFKLRHKITSGWLFFPDFEQFNHFVELFGVETALRLALGMKQGWALLEDWMELVEAAEVPELSAYYSREKSVYLLTDGQRWYGARLEELEDVSEVEAVIQDFNLECDAREEKNPGMTTWEYTEGVLERAGLRLADMQRATVEQVLQVAQGNDGNHTVH